MGEAQREKIAATTLEGDRRVFVLHRLLERRTVGYCDGAVTWLGRHTLGFCAKSWWGGRGGGIRLNCLLGRPR